MTDSNQSISPLRQRVIDDMTLRKLSPNTQAAYLRAVVRFTRFFGLSPDLASPEDLRAFNCTWSRPGYPPPRSMPPSPVWASCSA
jgi:hypothetical protein